MARGKCGGGAEGILNLDSGCLLHIDRHTLDLSKDVSFKALDMETTTGLHARAGGKTSRQQAKVVRVFWWYWQHTAPRKAMSHLALPGPGTGTGGLSICQGR